MEKTSCFTKFTLFLPILFLSLSAHAQTATNLSKLNKNGVILYTPYISRSVTPGQDITYSIDVINQSARIEVVRFSFRGIPSSWNPTLSSSSNTIQRIAVKPKRLAKDHSRNISLHLDIPLKIKKGTYHFDVLAKTDNGFRYKLPVRVKVTQKGTLTTSMNVQQANMQGYAGDDFNYHFALKNKTAKERTYALISDAPPGWSARFRVSGNYATSVRLASNSNKTVYVKVTSPKNVDAGTYNIPIQASSGNSIARDTLQTVIKGKYNLNLTTPTGRLSTKVTAGGKKEVKLQLENTGSLPLHNIKLSATTPDGWKVDFGSKQINHLNPGESTFVTATIKAGKKAIAGDYQLKIDANTKNSSSQAAFRISVTKSMMWGGISIAIIVIVIGGIFMMVRTYGRR
jgi:uncharacterized membrane protein